MEESVNKDVLMFLYKKTRLRVFSPFSAHFYPHYIIMVKGPLFLHIKLTHSH